MGRGIAALGDRLEFVVVTRESANASPPAKMESAAERPVGSIVIAAYNRARLLEKAVRSGLAQSHPGVEIVVSDDASPDDSVAVLRSIGDPRLRINAQHKNVGVRDNWTAALRMARGEFVVFLGDDDFLSENFVQRHLAVFAARPVLAAVFCPLAGISADGTARGVLAEPFPVDEATPASAVIGKLLASQIFLSGWEQKETGGSSKGDCCGDTAAVARHEEA